MFEDFNMELYRTEARWQEGEYTVTRTSVWTAPGCHNGCGVLLYSKNGKLEKIEGDPNAPFNRGRLCLRCINMIEQVYSNDRLKWPLKRVGEKGDNKWQRITWDEAYDIIEAKYNEIKDNHGVESIATLVGTGRNSMWQPAVITRAIFGSPNLCFGFLSGDSCYQPRMTANLIKLGDCVISDCSQTHPLREKNSEWKKPEVIVVWGNNPLVSNGDGFMGHWIVDMMRLGTKLIVVDPALTWLAAKADIWLRGRPGTDAALALGFLNVIINEDLYDHDFVENWTYGFEDLVERVKEYPPEKVADITWIPKDQIVEAARMYAKAKPAAIQWGLAIDMQMAAMEASGAITDLMALTGNIDVPGGNIIQRYAYNRSKKYGSAIEYIPEEMLLKRIGTYESPIHESGYTPFIPPDKLLECLETGRPYPVQMLWLQGTNPIANMAGEAPRVYAAMKKVPFCVVVDLFMTPSAVAFADLVLPAAMSVERDSFRAWWTPLRSIARGAEQYEQSKSDEEIVLDLGKRIRPDRFDKYKDVNEYLTQLLKEDGGVDYDFDTLVERVNDFWDWDYTYQKHEKGLLRSDGQPGFVTPTGLYEFTSPLFDVWGFDMLPKHIEPVEGPYTTPELMREFPLILTTGNRLWGCFHSEHRQLPTMREIHPDPMMDINPQTAKELGINEGDWVWLENRRGRCKQKARFNIGLDPKVVRGEHGWWFPEKEGAEPTLYGVFDSNINNLTTMGVHGPTHYGAPYKSTVCKVYKVTPENDRVSPTEIVTRMGGFSYAKR
ncbi:MAG: molybdopterin oxidoreductase [Firmicutes bacterium]|nr:molybdopterin oxidoreductase [Bacillota bacterium]